MENLTYMERETLQGAVNILNHPDVKKITFCIPSTNYARAIESMLDSCAMRYLIGIKNRDGSVDIIQPGKFGTPGTILFTYDKYMESKPDYRNKYIMYNCFRYNLMWDRREK